MARHSRKPTPTPDVAARPLGIDWARVDATTEADIARQIAEDPDTAPDLVAGVEAGWLVPVPPQGDPDPRPRKTPIALRVDPEVLAFFKAGGPGYQRRMHAVLRAYVRHQQRRAR